MGPSCKQSARGWDNDKAQLSLWRVLYLSSQTDYGLVCRFTDATAGFPALVNRRWVNGMKTAGDSIMEVPVGVVLQCSSEKSIQRHAFVQFDWGKLQREYVLLLQSLLWGMSFCLAKEIYHKSTFWFQTSFVVCTTGERITTQVFARMARACSQSGAVTQFQPLPPLPWRGLTTSVYL